MKLIDAAASFRVNTVFVIGYEGCSICTAIGHVLDMSDTNHNYICAAIGYVLYFLRAVACYRLSNILAMRVVC